jgi:hypothetical protein
MDEDTERGIIFTLGVILGLALMWLIFTARGRRAAQQMFETAEDVVGDLSAEAGDLMEQVTGR